MIDLKIVLRKAIDVKKLSQEMFERVDLATARAADIVLGSLRRHSMQDPLHGRTGNLARSWVVERNAPGSYSAVSRLPYSRILEYGGEIVPKRAKMLAIPLGEALTAGGVSRYKSPRDVPGLFLLRSKKGNLLLARRSGKSLDIMYVLKEKVTMPAFRYATLAVQESRASALAEIKRALAK